MPLSIKHPEADRLARELAEKTGESLTEAVIQALRERLERVRRRTRRIKLSEDLKTIGERCASLPVQDHRSPEEILSYDRDGVPR